MKKNLFFIITLPCIALALGIIGWKIFSLTKQTVPVESEFHIHADFKVFINNKPIDFSIEKYQSGHPGSTTTQHNDVVHLHDGNGEVIHLHKEGLTLGYFFKTLGMDLTDDCLKLDTGEMYCNNEDNQLQVFVNEQPSEQLRDYIPKNLDRILITYDNLLEAEKNIPLQMSAVTDKACIYSKTCPERGTPPIENCVSGQPCKK